MKCKLCLSISNKILCMECEKYYLFDNKINMIRKKKHKNCNTKEYNSETLLYKNLCKIYGYKDVYRHVYPSWSISNKGALLEFDIYIHSIKVCVEYDGIQHYQYPNFFHKRRRDFNDQKIRDLLKNKLARENNQILYRFRYDELIDEINVKRRIK